MQLGRRFSTLILAGTSVDEVWCRAANHAPLMASKNATCGVGTRETSRPAVQRVLTAELGDDGIGV